MRSRCKHGAQVSQSSFQPKLEKFKSTTHKPNSPRLHQPKSELFFEELPWAGQLAFGGEKARNLNLSEKRQFLYVKALVSLRKLPWACELAFGNEKIEIWTPQKSDDFFKWKRHFL